MANACFGEIVTQTKKDHFDCSSQQAVTVVHVNSVHCTTKQFRKQTRRSKDCCVYGDKHTGLPPALEKRQIQSLGVFG